MNTRRLVFKKFTTEDADAYMSWYTSDEVMKYITGKGLTQEEAQARFKKALDINATFPMAGFYAARIKTTGEYVGLIKFVYMGETQAEIGYGLVPPFWGKGYATEMANFLVEFGRQQKQLKVLIGIVNPGNKASVNVLRKMNFVFDKEDVENDKVIAFYKLTL